MIEYLALSVGPPSSGKTTLAEIFERWGFSIVGTRPILERYDPDFDPKSPRLVPDEKAIPILDAHIPRDRLVFLDSVRSLKQARWVRNELAPCAKLLVVHIDIDDEECVKRLKGRDARGDDHGIRIRLAKYREYEKELLDYLWPLSLSCRVGNVTKEETRRIVEARYENELFALTS